MIYLISILMTVSWIWHIVIAFKDGSVVWGVLMILFSPLVLIYGLLHWGLCKVPYIMLVISIALIFTLSPEDIRRISSDSATSSITVPQTAAFQQTSPV